MTSSAGGSEDERLELWSLYNDRHCQGEHIWVFPLRKWAQFDIWQYIAEEAIPVPPIYFGHRRKVFRRDGMLIADHHPLVERRDRGARQQKRGMAAGKTAGDGEDRWLQGKTWR